jgi:hypothetical protein
MDILIPAEYETESIKKGREILYRIVQDAREAKASGRNPKSIQVGKHLVHYIQAFFELKCQKFDGVIPKRMEGLPIFINEGDPNRVTIKCEK